MKVKEDWYALYIKPRWEKKVAERLENAGFEVYCPVVKQSRQWSDRIKIVVEPVFKGYVFIKVTKERLWEAVGFAGVIAPVRYLGKPAVIRESEIQTIRKFLNEFTEFEIESISISPESKVRIKQGVLMDYEGIVMEVYGTTALVKITSLGLQLKARFDKKNLEKI